MDLELEIKEDKENIQWIVEAKGDLDAFSSPNFSETVLKYFAQKKQNIILRADRLDYVDSTGLGALIGIYKELKDEGKTLILENLNATIKKLIHITELDKVFEIREG